MRSMPRTWPSMRWMRFTRASLRASLRATTGCSGRDALLRGDRAAIAGASAARVIAGVLDCRAQRGDAGFCGVEYDGRRAGLERHLRVADAGHRLQYARDARHASLAGHPADFDRCRFHRRLLLSVTSPPEGAVSHTIARAVVGRKSRSGSALVTTDTELAAIAAPAITGLRKPSAASG